MPTPISPPVPMRPTVARAIDYLDRQLSRSIELVHHFAAKIKAEPYGGWEEQHRYWLARAEGYQIVIGWRL